MATTVWRGNLTFGLVSIPVRLYKAARRERIRFEHVYRPAAVREPEADDEQIESEPPSPPRRVHELPPPAPEPQSVIRVRNQPVAGLTETPIDRPQILKGYEVAPDRYVTFQPREVAALRAPTSTELA